MADYDRFVAAVVKASGVAENAKDDAGNMLFGPRVDEQYKFDRLELSDADTERLETASEEFAQAVSAVRKKALGY